MTRAAIAAGFFGLGALAVSRDLAADPLGRVQRSGPSPAAETPRDPSLAMVPPWRDADDSAAARRRAQRDHPQGRSDDPRRARRVGASARLGRARRGAAAVRREARPGMRGALRQHRAARVGLPGCGDARRRAVPRGRIAGAVSGRPAFPVLLRRPRRIARLPEPRRRRRRGPRRRARGRLRGGGGRGAESRRRTLRPHAPRHVGSGARSRACRRVEVSRRPDRERRSVVGLDRRGQGAGVRQARAASEIGGPPPALRSRAHRRGEAHEGSSVPPGRGRGLGPRPRRAQNRARLRARPR